MTEFYLYQTLHLCHGRVRLLDRHVGVLDRCARELFDRPYAPDLRRLERQVLDFAVLHGYPDDLSAFVRLELTSEGEVRLIPLGVSYYEGYALRSVQPDGIGIRYEPPLNGYPTQAREAAVATARRMSECAGGRVAVQCGTDGMCRTIEGAPMAAVQGYTVWLAPESVPYEIPASRFELRLEGAPVRGHRFVAPRSVEYGLLVAAVEAAGLTLCEKPFDMDFLTGADEVFWLDYRGITALAHCDGRPLMSIIAERIAVALEGIFKDSVFMKRLLTIGMFAWFCAGCFFAACPASAKRPATTQRLASAGPRADKSTAAKHSVAVGMTDTVAYFPLLEGRRVAVLTNHTAVADMPGALGADSAGRIHLVDLLYRRGFDVTGIFSPEHGFRGKADAGETVGDAVDPSTGIPIRSLYNGNAQRPSERAMQSFDVLIVDMQDVGLRFYTYHISMLRLMEACAAVDKTVIVLDRPNPNGCHIDGPVLEKKYRSGVGMLPVPVLHGLTMGEIARMAIGEGWVAPCALTVVPCRNYTHSTEYLLPVPPSPNLPTQRAVYLYASLCPFEGTIVSVGRGTDLPYECFGHPSLFGFGYIFTPRPTAGAKHPPLEGSECRGINLSTVPLSDARALGFSLRYLIDALLASDAGEKFFTPMFEKLVGTAYVRVMLLDGATEAEIRARWQPDVERYRVLRARYVLYPD